MIKRHENYRELVLRLAKTDFKLRYHGSALGYLWAILKPLLMFTVLNFVFSSLFNFRNSGTPYYPLELITAILLFQFFSEGTTSGMNSLVSKAQLVTKIYVPRWTIVLGSTVNALFVFCMNLIVLAVFLVAYSKLPSLLGVVMFLVYSMLLYVLIVSFSLITAPLFVRFRDLSMIWEILLSVLMYAAPIVYPLSMIPEKFRHLVLINPLSFIIHFAKQALISNDFTKFSHFAILFLGVASIATVSFLIFKKSERSVAELI